MIASLILVLFTSPLVQAAPPDVPENVSAYPCPGSERWCLEIYWEPPSAGDTPSGYHVEVYHPGNNTGEGRRDVNHTSGSNYTQQYWVGEGQTRDLRVRAYNGDGTSDWVQVSATTHSGPDPVEGLTATPSYFHVDLAWLPVVDWGSSAADHYEVQMCSGGCETRNVDPNETTYRWYGLDMDTRYWFYVSAVNAQGYKGLIDSASATTWAAPSAPQNVTADPSHDEATISWDAPADAGHAPVRDYDLRYREPAGVWSYRYAGTASPYTLTFLEKGTSYETQLRAYNIDNIPGDWSGVVSFQTDTDPTAPRNALATAGPDAGEITVSWDPPLDDGGEPLDLYRVQYRVQDSGAAWSETDVTPPTTSAEIDGLESDTTYEARVLARNGHGFWSPASNIATTSTFAVPGAPENVAASGSDVGELTVTWDAPTDDGGTAVTFYTVYRSATSGGPYSPIGNATGTTYVDNGLADGTAYYYVVRATNAVGQGPQSGEGSGTTWDVPSAPQDLQATSGPGQGKITVSWDAPADDGGTPVTEYWVYRSTSASGTFTKIATVSAATTSHVDSGLTAGQVYHYRARAINAVGGGPDSNTDWALPGIL